MDTQTKTLFVIQRLIVKGNKSDNSDGLWEDLSDGVFTDKTVALIYYNKRHSEEDKKSEFPLRLIKRVILIEEEII